MEQIIDMWISTKRPCLKIRRESSGSLIKEHVVTLLKPSGEVLELFILSDGLDFISQVEKPLELTEGGVRRDRRSLTDMMDDCVVVYKDRDEWAKSKKELKSYQSLEDFMTYKVAGIMDSLFGIEYGGFKVISTDIVDKRTLAVIVMYEDEIIDTLVEFRVGVRKVLTYRKSTYPVNGFMNYLGQLTNSAVVEVG